MKKMVFIACALMIVAAGSAMAGTNLAWTDCIGGGGTTNLALLCTNTGSSTAYCTFVTPVAIPLMATSDFQIDIQTPTSVTSWWLTNPTTTRLDSGKNDPASGLCPGWWTGAPSGPIVFSPTVSQTNASRLRLHLVAVIAAGEERNIAVDGTELFGGSLLLKKSAGTLNNAECLAGGAIGITNLEILQPGGAPPIEITTPEVSNCVTVRSPATTPCPGATPTKKATWGSIKALYR